MRNAILDTSKYPKEIKEILLGLIRINPTERWTMEQCLHHSTFGYKPKIFVPKIYKPLTDVILNKEVIKQCQRNEAQKPITVITACHIISKTGCSVKVACELAHKFYETKLRDISLDDYGEEEFDVFQRMDYNLII